MLQRGLHRSQLWACYNFCSLLISLSAWFNMTLLMIIRMNPFFCIFLLLFLRSYHLICYFFLYCLQKRMYEQESGLFDFRRTETSSLLLVIDRREDPVTPLLNQWTYQVHFHPLSIQFNYDGFCCWHVYLLKLTNGFIGYGTWADWYSW